MSDSVSLSNAEWRGVRLGEISKEISYGYTESANSKPVGPKFLRITDIAGGKPSWDKVPYCSISKENLEKYLLRTGDIVIARTGATTGATYTLKPQDPDDVVFASYLIRCTINDTLANPYFVDFVLRSYSWIGFVEGIKGGSAQPGANAKQFASFEFSLPPLPEQKAIAEVLSSLDDKIDLLHRQNKTLEQMAQTLFRQWFVVDAREDWEEKPLNKCVDIAIGRTPPRKQKHWFSTNGQDIKWISIKDMGDSGVFIFDTSECLTVEAVNNFNIPVIPIDTVVLSFKMTLGRVGITSENMLSNEAIAQFKFSSETPFSKEYLYLFLKAYPYQTLGSTSSIVTSINSSMIKHLVISIPDAKTLFLFNEQVKFGFLKIKENQTQIRTLESLRDTLLPKLMSGEVRIASNG